MRRVSICYVASIFQMSMSIGAQYGTNSSIRSALSIYELRRLPDHVVSLAARTPIRTPLLPTPHLMQDVVICLRHLRDETGVGSGCPAAQPLHLDIEKVAHAADIEVRQSGYAISGAIPVLAHDRQIDLRQVSFLPLQIPAPPREEDEFVLDPIVLVF